MYVYKAIKSMCFCIKLGFAYDDWRSYILNWKYQNAVVFKEQSVSHHSKEEECKQLIGLSCKKNKYFKKIINNQPYP